MVYILLIPFDVFASTRHIENVFYLHLPYVNKVFRIKMYDLYFVSYILMIFMSFIGLPFSYFYAQSVQDEEEESIASESE